jgi:hypothetical protein
VNVALSDLRFAKSFPLADVMGTRQLARLQADLDANARREGEAGEGSETTDGEDEPPEPKFNPFSLLSDDDGEVRGTLKGQRKGWCKSWLALVRVALVASLWKPPRRP